MTHARIDYDFAIEKAKDLFWRQGYDDTSIDEIVKLSGLNRYAIYNAYGGKEGLFEASVTRYCQEALSKLKADYEEPDLAALDALLDNLVRAITCMTEKASGCLVTDVVLSKKTHFPKLVTYCQNYLDETERLISLLFMKAASAGQLKSGLTPEEATMLFMTFKLGLDRRCKLGFSLDYLTKQARIFITHIGRNSD